MVGYPDKDRQKLLAIEERNKLPGLKFYSYNTRSGPWTAGYSPK